MSSKLSVEPTDNEQVNENPFYAPDYNRTGSVESANDLQAQFDPNSTNNPKQRNTHNFGSNQIEVENMDPSIKSSF